MNRPLTSQQQAVYDFIRDKIVSRGYGPTVREIGEHMHIKSPNGVMCHLRALERKGMLTRTANKSRAIELTEPVSRLMGGSLPIGARFSGGICRLNSSTAQSFDLGQLVAPDRYLLEVVDDSLLVANIQSGDGLVIQKQDTASSGQMVLIRNNELESSLCIWHSESGKVRLQSLQGSAVLRAMDEVQILGVVVGLVRLYADFGKVSAAC